MLRILTTDGKEWFYHGSEDALRGLIKRGVTIKVAASQEAAADWKILTGHIVGFRKQ